MSGPELAIYRGSSGQNKMWFVLSRGDKCMWVSFSLINVWCITHYFAFCFATPKHSPHPHFQQESYFKPPPSLPLFNPWLYSYSWKPILKRVDFRFDIFIPFLRQKQWSEVWFAYGLGGFSYFIGRFFKLNFGRLKNKISNFLSNEYNFS